MGLLTNILTRRLLEKHMDPREIPGFMRSLASALAASPYGDRRSLNRRLRSLGWADFELDDHTLQLFVASCEIDGSCGANNPFNQTFANPVQERIWNDGSAFEG